MPFSIKGMSIDRRTHIFVLFLFRAQESHLVTKMYVTRIDRFLIMKKYEIGHKAFLFFKNHSRKLLKKYSVQIKEEIKYSLRRITYTTEEAIFTVIDASSD
jgi:hypothetical protein